MQSPPPPPLMPIPVAPIPPVPVARLFDPSSSVALATFLGSPIAGAIVLSMNYRQLGRSGPALTSILLGLLGTALLLVVAFMAPDKTPRALIYLPPLIAMAAIAKSLQGEVFAEHKRDGGAVRSSWGAAGIGLLALVVIGGGVFGAIYFTNKIPGTRLMVGLKDEIYYQGTATVDEAKALGEGLKDLGYFTDRGVTVLLSKGPGGTSISFVVSDGAWDRPDVTGTFETIGGKLAPKVGGLPITIRLISDQLDLKKEIPVTKSDSVTSPLGR